MKFRALVVDGVFNWGFSVRAVYTSAASQPYPLPPPTTLVGALAASYVRIKGLPEVIIKNGMIYSRAAELLNDVLWATIKIHSYAIMYSDMGRLVRTHYLRDEYRRDPKRWFGISSVGKVYSNSSFRIIYILRGTNKVPYETLGRSIVSLGSKEGLVHIKDSRVVDAVVTGKKYDIETPYYTFRRLIEDYEVGTGVIVKMPPYPPPISYYRVREVVGITEVHEDYVIPYMEGQVITGRPISIHEVSDDAMVIEVNIEGEKEYVIAPSLTR